MECEREKNSENCPCTWKSCDRKGVCCECVKYHLNQEEVPACFFPSNIEKTYDRSIRRFVEIYNKQ